MLENDYLNQYGWIPAALSIGENPKRRGLKLKSFNVRYRDYFSRWQIKDNITDPETDKKIKRLDEISDEVNCVIETEPLDPKKLCNLVKEAYRICGSPSDDFIEKVLRVYREAKP